MIAVTSSKQWIHFFRSDLWPPTSNSLERNDKCQGTGKTKWKMEWTSAVFSQSGESFWNMEIAYIYPSRKRTVSPFIVSLIDHLFTKTLWNRSLKEGWKHIHKFIFKVLFFNMHSTIGFTNLWKCQLLLQLIMPYLYLNLPLSLPSLTANNSFV